MKRNPEISVIVLTYNQSLTIGRTLDSILAQQCNFPYEIVISDDSPDDSTRRAIEPYLKAFPSVVRLLPKHEQFGVVRNYFYALSHCRGKFIADCAGDDYWYGFLGFQKKRDILVANPNVAFVHSEWLRRDLCAHDSTALFPSLKFGSKYRCDYADGRELLPMVLTSDGEPLIHLSTVVYRRKIIDDALAANRAMVENPLWQCEDLPIVAALLAAGMEVRWLGEPTLAYSVGGNTITSPQESSAVARFYSAAAVMILELSDYYGISRKKIAPALNAKFHFAMSHAILSRDEDVLTAVRQAIAQNKIRRPILDRLKEFVKTIRVRFSH